MFNLLFVVVYMIVSIKMLAFISDVYNIELTDYEGVMIMVIWPLIIITALIIKLKRNYE